MALDSWWSVALPLCRRGTLVVMSAVLVLAGASCRRSPSLSTDDPALAALGALRWGVPVALSIGVGAECRAFTLGRDDVACGAGERSADADADSTLARVAGLTKRDSTRSSARVSALIDLWYARTDARALERAIVALRDATLSPPDSCDAWIDLSAALLMRRGADGNVLDLFEALHAAQEGVRCNPASTEARWNKAVALTWLGLREEQEIAWKEYATHGGRAVPSVGLDGDPLRMTPAQAGQIGRWVDAARDEVWRRIMPRWGAAVIAEDSASADDALRALARLAASSKRHDSVDGPSGVMKVVSIIRTTTERRELATGFVAFGELRDALDQSDRPRAARALERAVDSPAFVRHFGRWIDYQRANLLLLGGNHAHARESLLMLADRERNSAPVVARRARWGAALALQVMERQADAAVELGSVADACEAANEEECVVGALSALGATQLLRGDTDRATAALLRALRKSCDVPLTSRRWSAMAQLGQIAAMERLDGATAALDREQDAVALSLKRPDLRILSARRRAEVAIERGSQTSADSSVDLFSSLWETETSASVQQEYRADYVWIRGERARRKREANAFTLLDSAVQLSVASKGSRVRTLRMRFSRARAAADRDTTLALGELDTLLADLRARGGTKATVFESALLAEVARHASALAGRLLMARGDAKRSLDALSGRRFVGAAYAPAAPLSRATGATRSATIAVRELGDSLVVWHDVAGEIRARVSTLRVRDVRRLALRRDVEALRELHDGLVVETLARADSLATPATLRLDVRGVASSVPWSALMDRANGRYLIDDYESVLVDRAWSDAQSRDARNAVPRGAATRVVILDAAPRSGARRLGGAVREVESLATLWGASARVVSGDDVLSSLGSSWRGVHTLHFAGHAMVDDRVPERSALLVSSSRGDSLVRASTIAKFDLRGVQLVILAACDTRVAGGTPLGGLESLAGVLRAAGAANVIGAGWPVDDDATADLMLEVHRQLREGESPATALRRAQLRLRQSSDPTRNAPRVWAAFQLLGS